MPLLGAAVVLDDDDRLGDVVQLAGEVAGVGRLQRGVGQTLPGTVRRGEVLEHVQAFAEVRADRRLDDLAARLGHQATHAGELLHLADVASRARGRHEVDRVQVPGPRRSRRAARAGLDAAVVLERLDQLLGDLLTAVRPEVEQLVVPLALGDGTGVVVALDAIDLLLRLIEERLLARRDPQVGDADREPRGRRRLEPDLLHVVEQRRAWHGRPSRGVGVVDDAAAALLAERAVVERHAVGQDVVEDARGRRS